jgi:hypothetical protein
VLLLALAKQRGRHHLAVERENEAARVEKEDPTPAP